MVSKRAAIFLDRDGVLNIPFIKNGKSYAPLKAKNFRLYPFVIKMCEKLKRKYLLIVVTNQPDLENGKLKKQELFLMNNSLKEKINYDALYYCSSKSSRSKNRKPNPGMLLKSIKEFDININKSYLIGDRCSDIVAGNKVKCKTIFIDRNYKETKPMNQDFTAKSFRQAVGYILNEKD